MYQGIAVETFGTFSDSAKFFVKKLGLILNYKSGNVQATSFFLQKISFAIQTWERSGNHWNDPTHFEN